MSGNGSKSGRSAYSARWVPRLARWLAGAGMTEEEIAGELDITSRTLRNWKADHPELAEAIAEGKAPVDDQVEGALLRRALGFTYHERLVGGEVERVALPDVGACSLWLRNRRPDRWRDSRDVRVGDLDAQGVAALRAALVDALDEELGDEAAFRVLDRLDDALGGEGDG